MQQQHRRDDSGGLQDWLEVADTVFEFGEVVLELALDATEGAREVAGGLFSLLDGF